MAPGTTITNKQEIDRRRSQIPNHQIAGGRETSSSRRYLTHDEAAEVNRSPSTRQQFDRWRHVPTLELHYYPKGVAPEDPLCLS